MDRLENTNYEVKGAVPRYFNILKKKLKNFVSSFAVKDYMIAREVFTVVCTANGKDVGMD